MLTRRERWLLAVPLAGGAVFGLLPFLAPTQLAQLTGYAGDDPYVGRLAGAATFGYAVALALGIRDGRWAPLRPVVVATLTFNLVSIVACTIEIAADRAQPVVYLIGLASIVISLITWTLLVVNGATPQGPREVASWVVGLAVLGTIASATFGLTLQLPKIFGPLGGYHGTDEFLYRQAGAATLGYVALVGGVWELRSPRWEELRLPTIMALVASGMAFLASLVELGAVTLGVALIAPASLLLTIGTGAALARKGR